MTKKSKPTEQDIIFGRHAVSSVLEKGEASIEKIWVQKGLHFPSHLHDQIRRAARQGMVIQYVDRPALERITNRGNHQGVAVRTALVSFTGLDEWLGRNLSKNLLVLVLDGIQDPGNLGAVIRTAAAAGVDAVIIPKHATAPLGGAAMKASAGTLNRIPVIKVSNLRNAVVELKENGFYVTGISEKGSGSITDIPVCGKTAFVFGSEERGIRMLLQKQCDTIRRIPLTGPAGSLNVSAAVAIVLYEYVCGRDRNQKKN
jgi:23S rRNA (guanosine2251-2'-O)-methyltransferase